MSIPGFVVSTAALVDCVRADAEQNGCEVPILFGEDYVAQHAAANRVIFYPSTRAEQFRPPQQIQAVGVMPQTVAYWQSMGGANPRPIWTRVMTVHVNIWARAVTQSDPKRQRAADEAALHALLNQVLLSMWNAMHGACELVAGKKTVDPKTTGNGLFYELELNWLVPILDVAFEPGFIDNTARTWPMEPADGAVTVEMLGPDEQTVINEVEFQATGS